MALGSLPSCGGKDGSPADGGTAGAAGGAGGEGGGGGSGGAAGSPPSVFPSGTVTQCYGDGCPMGACDDGQFFADVKCSEVYTTPVSASSTYCNPGESSGYCLQIQDATSGQLFGITCTDGAAFGKRCPGGCGTGANRVICN
jgi:hypothetical protein